MILTKKGTQFWYIFKNFVSYISLFWRNCKKNQEQLPLLFLSFGRIAYVRIKSVFILKTCGWHYERFTQTIKSRTEKKLRTTFLTKDIVIF